MVYILCAVYRLYNIAKYMQSDKDRRKSTRIFHWNSTMLIKSSTSIYSLSTDFRSNSELILGAENVVDFK